MEQYEREYLISRVMTGYLRYPIREDLVLRIYSTTPDQNYVANEVYNKAYNEAALRGVISNEEMLKKIIEMGIWTDEDQEMLAQIPKDIEEWKVQIYNALHNEDQKNRLKKYLRRAEDVLTEVYSKKTCFDHYTREGTATYARTIWAVENCTRYENEEIYGWKDIGVSSALSFFKDNSADEKSLRELSRTEPWRSMWVTNKKVGRDLFHNNKYMLNDEQKSLILWSNMYDNIHESSESPADEVMEDDDMLDGWLIVQRRKRNKQQNEKMIDDKTNNEKISQSDEVFVMARSTAEAEKINDANDVHSRMVKRSRETKITASDQVTEHSDFQDVRLEIRQQQNELFKSNVRR